ncbi:hypothetical protein CJ010_18490 [Azoarcus sp. DD4]|nr:hypothetical protein CJ010_18490 [Azoarcus sp. DD4]
MVPTLAENTTFVELKTAKTTGLGMAQLGIPVQDDTQVKKGKLHEFIQLTHDDKVGRRYQNIRVTAVKTAEGGIDSAKVFFQFEAFGDDNVPEAPGSAAFSVALFAGDTCLLALPASSLFLPYGRAWYENQFVYEVPLAAFDQADRLQFTVKADQVRMI